MVPHLLRCVGRFVCCRAAFPSARVFVLNSSEAKGSCLCPPFSVFCKFPLSPSGRIVRADNFHFPFKTALRPPVPGRGFLFSAGRISLAGKILLRQIIFAQ